MTQINIQQLQIINLQMSVSNPANKNDEARRTSFYPGNHNAANNYNEASGYRQTPVVNNLNDGSNMNGNNDAAMNRDLSNKVENIIS